MLGFSNKCFPPFFFPNSVTQVWEKGQRNVEASHVQPI